MIDDEPVDVTRSKGDRCGVCSEGFAKQCVYFAGHLEKLHRFADRDLPWPPAYFLLQENDDDAEG